MHSSSTYFVIAWLVPDATQSQPLLTRKVQGRLPVWPCNRSSELGWHTYCIWRASSGVAASLPKGPELCWWREKYITSSPLLSFHDLSSRTREFDRLTHIKGPGVHIIWMYLKACTWKLRHQVQRSGEDGDVTDHTQKCCICMLL